MEILEIFNQLPVYHSVQELILLLTDNIIGFEHILIFLPKFPNLSRLHLNFETGVITNAFRRPLDILNPCLKVIEIYNAEKNIIEKMRLHGRTDIKIILKNVHAPALAKRIFYKKNPGFPRENIVEKFLY